MRSRTWLVGALVVGLGGPATAQPAPQQPAPQGAKPASPRKRAPRKPKNAKPPIDLTPEIAALEGASVEAAVKAAGALGAVNEPAAHDALLDALAFGMPAPVAIAAINAVAQHPAPLDVTSLVRYAAHRNPGVRSAALTVLARYPDPVARTALLAGLRDMTATVRTAASTAAASARVRAAIEPMLELMARGDESAAHALAGMADAELARKLGDQLGKVPEALLAQTLGIVLRRADFGPDPARVELVRAIGKIQDPQAVAALTDYLDATPRNPPRASRTEAQRMVEARLGGGK